jgi:phosphohistidine phosphatase
LAARLVKRLWILRHAKSSWDYPGLADHDRPLAPRGRKAGKRIARWADANGVRPDLVLCSSAARAQATLELVRPGLGDPAVVVESGVYQAGATELVARLSVIDDDVTGVLVLGHNPAMLDLAARLAPPGPDAFPTGALACLSLEVESWNGLRSGCGRLDDLVVPRSLTA